MKGQSLLIVEDDRDIQDSLREVLEMEGFQVEIVSNGQEALSFLEKGKPVNGILLDLMMPIMDGYEFLDHFYSKKNRQAIPIVVLSASPDAIRIATERNLRYVKKPIDLDLLLKAVQPLSV